MVEREILKDMGFSRGKGWTHEVWVNDGGWFWVHYNHPLIVRLEGQEVNGDSVNRRKFFDMYFAAMENEWNESQPRDFQY